MWTNWALWALLVRREPGAAIVEDRGAGPQRVAHGMATGPAISLPEINPEERKAGPRTTVCVRSQQHHPQSPKGRNSQAPVTGRTDKQGVVHRSVEYYSASKRKERLAHATTWTDGTWRARWARSARHRGRTRYDPTSPRGPGVKLTETESRWWVWVVCVLGGGGGGGSSSLRGQFPFVMINGSGGGWQ